MTPSSELTPEAIAARRVRSAETTQNQRLMFRVGALYGISLLGMRLPLGNTESIESGPISVTIDPDAHPSCNLGVVDYERRHLKVRYGAQLVFPGLFELVKTGKYDPGLLRPVRATATDECTVSDDYRGWRALGCLDFLPGSLWAGADGG